MNDSLKVNFTDQLQKSLTKNCYKKCRNIANQECFDVCFEKYIRTIAAVNSQLKDLGYEKHSLIAYKGYPQHTITNAYFYDEDTTVNFPHAPFVWNDKYAA